MALFIKDVEGRYLSMNQAGAKMLNRPLEEVLGATDFDIFDKRTARILSIRDSFIAKRSDPYAFEWLAPVVGYPAVQKFFCIKHPLRTAIGRISNGVLGLSFNTTSAGPGPSKEYALTLMTELMTKRISTLVELSRRQGILHSVSI